LLKAKKKEKIYKPLINGSKKSPPKVSPNKLTISGEKAKDLSHFLMKDKEADKNKVKE
jgi:hypothetical protein